MLSVYAIKDSSFVEIEPPKSHDALNGAVWFDLYNPTKEEEELVERVMQYDVPTREELHEIEVSSRLYQENGTLYATPNIMTYFDKKIPESNSVSFILNSNRLLTVRYCDPGAFRYYKAKPSACEIVPTNGSDIMIGLIESIVTFAADALELVGRNLDETAMQVFHPKSISPENCKYCPECTVVHDNVRHDFKAILQTIGAMGDIVSKCRESLITLIRLNGYIRETQHYRDNRDTVQIIDMLTRDITSLADHASFLSNKVSFLLDATLGMVNIEQNGIIKIFSVAAVIFLPPTMIASIYGMNFSFMPELSWKMGYPMAVMLMIMSVFIPYRFFRKKGWL